MCTVTYIPGKHCFHITSNRDENVARQNAIAPGILDIGENKLLYPVDADKSGSWIAAKNNGDLVVLLNGAFVKHSRQQSYRRSRGLVLMDIIRDEHPDQYFKLIDLEDIEPFTIVLYASNKLYECRWDGAKKHISLLNKQTAYIWSSVTLYDKMATAKRDSWFEDWRRTEYPKTTTGIIHFHRYAGKGDLNDGLIINRGEKMKTMSITNIRVTSDNMTMTHIDLRNGKNYVNEIDIAAPQKAYSSTNVLPRFFGLRRFFIRLFNWEYWSFNTVYSPIMFYWFWLSLKSRSFFFFNTANPLIENGGFAMESKWLIYQMSKQFTPKTLLFKTGVSAEIIKQSIQQENLTFPIILKPDIGGRGVLVKKIHNNVELADYVKHMKVDFLVQDFIPYKNEVGIFYYRMPGEAKGRISGIVGKEFLSVTGDGKSTIVQLLIKEQRYLLQLPELAATYGDLLQQVLRNGDKQILVPYGNHARGAKFIDLSYLITDQLTEVIDSVCQEIPEFYFGRMDLMYDNWEELCEGKNFAIVELNGAGSEPTHIYDPKHSIFFAWKEIIRHWKLLNDVSRINHQHKNLKYMTYKEGTALLKNNARYLQLVS
ncbi:NRDE family protein [Mucilaginibacter sp. X4EP1]|uniref:NRDE family protein n=1 Tax=Mucilaginibacter sp. X4EP1 TaxID=2723092 RepID=UPI002169D793|nr:NRDE family protein [Mucilaginibacter sp. X4EP1]MCS3814778.1 hypothetical protein [Mucilaginibacter sp. X4EP1]